MLRPSLSAADAGEGFAMPEAFPFVLLAGKEAGAEQASAVEEAVPEAVVWTPGGGNAINPIFDAYVRRPTQAGRTARQALVLALAETGGLGAQAPGAADFSSYGVTRSPFAPAPETEIPVVKLARPKRSRPSLRDEPAGPSEGMEASETGEASTTALTAEEAPAATHEAAAGPSVPLEAGALRLKIALRRPEAAAASIAPVAVPPPDAPFLVGPVMDGTHAPLLPIPQMSGSRAPLSGGAMAGGSPGAAAAPVFKLQRLSDADKSESSLFTESERGMWWGRVAVSALAIAFLVLGTYEWQQRGLWPFTPDSQGAYTVALTSAAAPTSAVAPTATPPASPVPAAAPALPVTEAHAAGQGLEHVVAPAVIEPAAPPAPTAEFIALVEKFKVTGVMQGSPVRAIVDGRLVQAGDLVEFSREVRLVALDAEKHRLIFEDHTLAQTSVGY